LQIYIYKLLKFNNLNVNILSIYYKKQWWKIALISIAVVIGVSSLYYTNILVKKLSVEERKKVEIWAEATRLTNEADNSEKTLSFLLQVIQNNRTVPVILTDSSNKILSWRNLDSVKASKPGYVKEQLSLMKKEKEPIVINISNNNKNYIYYHESYLLQQLTYYPYIQLGVILLFIVVAYLAFSASRKAEQNQVWVGLTKETAHQLGTPTSSLMAWSELMKERLPEIELISELEKDVKRLEIITERFSKIGSKPTLKPTNLTETIKSAVEYLSSRTSDKINFSFDFPEKGTIIALNRSLFEWVIENLCKNSVDAISNEGNITIVVKEVKNKIFIDIADTGKGVPKSKYKTIFKPGYTTKTRGWGLGLSLVKRIVENYHQGNIFVLNSEIGKGTTIRIVLKNNINK
jgi:K+-sensing histidine kinase KdpD